jgi:hypothetical protein
MARATWAASSFQSPITTAAPSRANAMAVAAPMPVAPPVMTTVLLEKRIR